MMRTVLPVERFGRRRRQVIIGGGRWLFGKRIRSSLVVGVLFEPRDLWIGVYHTGFIDGSGRSRWCRTFYVCLIPMLPLKIDLWIEKRSRP